MKRKRKQPAVAPSMNMHDPLETQASAKDVRNGDSTSVTRLYLDRTPND
jgi:hypothetical protein